MCDGCFSLNTYGYQPSEYVGAGEVGYGGDMPFGPNGPPLEASTASGEGRNTPPGSEHQSGEREYKFSTEERHSPCEESTLPPRSPAQ